MRHFLLALSLLAAVLTTAATADYRIKQDFGGSVEQYKAKYAALRDGGERVVIDGICNSACTLVLGIVPLDRICVTPRANLGFHMAFYDLAATGGAKVLSYTASADLMAYYPEAVKEWLRQHGGLTAEVKSLPSGPELWGIVAPCPEEL